MQGVEEIAHEGVFFFVQLLEKSFQFQIGVLSDVAQEGSGIEFFKRLSLQGEHGFGDFAQAAAPFQQAFEFGADTVFLFDNDFTQERVFATIMFVEGNAADGCFFADSAHGYSGKTVFAEQAASGGDDGLLFAGGHRCLLFV